MASSLVLDHVTKRYGDGAAVLNEWSRTVDAGTLTLLVGPNGAGKTTLLRLLSVLAYPTSGAIQYGSLNIHEHPHQYLQHVGIVHAGPQLPEHLTAVELLTWILRGRDHWDEGGPDRIDSLLSTLQLDEQRSNLIGTYSSGMVQKTQIAAALISEPDVLLMDEPLRSLDQATADATVDLIDDFVDRGGLAVIASHLTDALRPLADATLTLGKKISTPGKS